VQAKAKSVDINEVIKIVGDIDYDLGTIEAGKDVHITGTVRSGFAVRAGGSIAIGGAVESGCSINARGDITVAQGVGGETTQLIARGDVRAGGRLAVRSGGEQRGGSIVGGQATAAGGIWAKRVGSPASDRTVVAVGPSPEVAARLHKLDQGIEFYRTNILRAFRTLGLPEVDAAHFKQLIQKVPRHQREPVMKVLHQLKGLTNTREKSLHLRRQLEKEITKTTAEAEIKIADTIFADAEIFMGEDRYIVPEDMGRAVFFLSEEGVRYREAVTG